MAQIDYRDVLQALVHKKINFMVVGGFASVAHGVVRATLFGVLCPVTTIDNLIRQKKIAGRPKDLEDIRELRSLKKK